MTGAEVTQPLRTDAADRVVLAVAEALRARRRLPVRDSRRQTGQWLRPNWPAQLLLSTHRRRLVEQLQEDQALRSETREILGIGERCDSFAAQSEQDLSAGLAERLVAASNPARVLLAAATDPDGTVASAASRYLMRELECPAPQSREPETRDTPLNRVDDANQREELRRLRTEKAQATKAAAAAIRDRDRALTSVEEHVNVTAQLRRELQQVREQLPTKRERAAMAAAATQERRIEALERKLRQSQKRLLDQERAARRELDGLGKKLADLLDELDAERRGRRQLEVELGDAAARAARLLVLIERERSSLDEEIAAKRPGPERTRASRRADALKELECLLRRVYALDAVRDEGIADEQQAITTRSRALRVTALGGGNHIGGSCILVEAGDTRLLVDVGLRPNAPLTHPGPERLDEQTVETLDAIFVTHAHADHAGFVPWVLGRRPSLPVLCSPETAALLPTVWNDSARVMRAEADSRADGAEPPYGDADINLAEEKLSIVRHGATRGVGSLELTAFKAGHILGAAGVVIRAGDRKVVITGDIDDRGQLSIGAAEIPPKLAAEADLLVIESTYCDSNHRDRLQESGDLVVATSSVLNRGGRILIPAFGLGRAQEIALLLRQELPDVDVRIDGLARAISELYEQNGAPQVLGGNVLKVQDRTREVRGFRAGVVITTSGMLTGGAAIPWAQAVLAEPESALFLCGHQDEEAPGYQLESLANNPDDSPRQVILKDDQNRPVVVDVKATVERYNLSAHADRRGLTGIIQQIRPHATMLVHGERAPQARFRTLLEGSGFRVVPNTETWDADAPVPDARRAHMRHGASASRRGSRIRSSR